MVYSTIVLLLAMAWLGRLVFRSVAEAKSSVKLNSGL